MESSVTKRGGIAFPLFVALSVVAFDQLTKFLVVKNIPCGEVAFSFFGDFLRIVHVRNFGVAFSIGSTFPLFLRRILFAIGPLAATVFLIYFFFKKKDEFSALERFALAGVIGGAFGNLIDRFFRPAGVVDFIDVKFYNLFALERWPTFNVADSAVCVGVILTIFSFISTRRKKDK